MSRILTLHLKARYWNQIKAGAKEREFRLFSDYWRTRLIGKCFDEIHLIAGYPSKEDTPEKTIRCKWAGYEITNLQHEEFGEKPVRVFAIDVSERVVE